MPNNALGTAVIEVVPNLSNLTATQAWSRVSSSVEMVRSAWANPVQAITL